MTHYSHVTSSCFFVFFFNDAATTEIYTLSLHDALPILPPLLGARIARARGERAVSDQADEREEGQRQRPGYRDGADRKSTRLNSSHVSISYAVFCLKKKTNNSKQYTISLLIIPS